MSSQDAAIEAELSREQRAALDQFCELLGVPRGRWRSVPALAQVFETAAVARYAARLRRRPGYNASREFCERLAAESLGLKHETVQHRRYRWQLMSNGACESQDPRAPDAARLRRSPAAP